MPAELPDLDTNHTEKTTNVRHPSTNGYINPPSHNKNSTFVALAKASAAIKTKRGAQVHTPP